MIPRDLEIKGYKLVNEFKEGGQSKTYLLEKDSLLYILKIPKNKLTDETLFRLSREIEALNALNGNGVPKIIEFNASFSNPFILMEYIDGKTLSAFSNGKPFQYKEAKEILISLLNIIQNAHNLGLYHRDLKPDNIIIKNNSTSPIIIDFGICWIKNSFQNDFNTDSNKELGNRFLRLPELSKGTRVTISTSDITFLVGIFFYLLSGKSPNLLLNEKGELPHKNPGLTHLHSLKEWSFLKYFFDRGFTYQVAHRYQTTEELLTHLNLLEMEDKNDIVSDFSNELNKLLNSDKIKLLDEIVDFIKEAHDSFLGGFSSTIHNGLIYGGSGPNFSEPQKKVITQMFLVKKNSGGPSINFHFISSIDDTLTTITTQWGTDSFKETLIVSISEKERFIESSNQKGKQCAQIAMKDFIDALKKMY